MANGNKVNANPGNWSQFGLVGGQEGFLEEDDSDVLACCHVEDIPSPLVGRSEIGLPDSKIGIGNSLGPGFGSMPCSVKSCRCRFRP